MNDQLTSVTNFPSEQEAIRAKCFHPRGRSLNSRKKRSSNRLRSDSRRLLQGIRPDRDQDEVMPYYDSPKNSQSFLRALQISSVKNRAGITPLPLCLFRLPVLRPENLGRG